MTKIIIGRDSDTSKLRMTVGGKSMATADYGIMPKSVGREHISITIEDNGDMILRNLNIENDTYVNGQGVEVKKVKRGDSIELGQERFRLKQELLDAFMPKYADIRPLERVWKNFKNNQIKIQIKERKFNALRNATGLLTIAAVALSGVFGRDNPVYLWLYGLAAVISALFFILSYRWASKIPLENARLQEETEKKYKCPNCGKLYPLQKYEQLKQQGRCMHCKAIFIS